MRYGEGGASGEGGVLPDEVEELVVSLEGLRRRRKGMEGRMKVGKRSVGERRGRKDIDGCSSTIGVCKLVAAAGFDGGRCLNGNCWLMCQSEVWFTMEYGEPQGNKGW